MNQSFTDVQTLGIQAANGAGVPPAQALAFGAMLARHLADKGSEAAIAAVLNTPDTIVALAMRIERVIEAASLGVIPVSILETDPNLRTLLISWLHGLPCQAEMKLQGDKICVSLNLLAPSQRQRPEFVLLGPALKHQMEGLAAATQLADADPSRNVGAGAGQMELD